MTLWGGKRVAGPGKKIGRPKELSSQVKRSIVLEPKQIDKIERLRDLWKLGSFNATVRYILDRFDFE